MDKNARDGWPELTYRYVEHYYWEPQHLRPKQPSAKRRGESGVEAVYRKLRKQEVPLNYLLNVLLRLAPSSLRGACLRPFGIDPGETLGALSLMTPRDWPTIQPDVHLESSMARVFIEVKVDAPLTSEQVKKYVDLHAALDADAGTSKAAYVLFLVRRAELLLADMDLKMPHSRVRVELPSALPELQRSNVTFGSTNWARFGATLTQEAARPRDGEANEMVSVLLGDFLQDLGVRGLLASQ